MFEHRLRLFLGILLCVMGVLLMRAFHLQVITKGKWQRDAEDFNKRAIYTETTRGRILDHNGTELAVDQGCMDACVDYRAISRNPKWIDSVAAQRLIERMGERAYRGTPKAQRVKMVAEEAVQVNGDIDRMWATLAAVSKESPTVSDADALAKIEELCNAINLKVAMRSRYVQYKRYQLADEEHEKSGPPPWYRRWLIEGGDGGPSVDDFEQDSGEESDVHPIVKNITNETYLRLSREQARAPGLVLRAGTIRRYHHGKAGAHVLGLLTSVTRKDIDGALDLEDELRKYELTDLIGRGGIEGMCEAPLRGTRGKVLRQAGRTDQDKVISFPTPGRDVKTTIDIGLQGELQAMFEHMQVPVEYGKDQPTIEVPMHGAAVVIDVKSGNVRALASYPDYDVNELQRNFEAIAGDQDEAPMMNRATQSQLEPGSTIKPVVGLSAISQHLNVAGVGVMTARSGIECTGYLVLNGRKMPNGRCWTATKYAKQLGDAGVMHHPFPLPHRGSYGNKDGHLVFADALERSCNVYFETCADSLGIIGLSYWFDRFGLGRETGIGISEARGYLPTRISSPMPSHAWFSGIGQTGVLATPIQMANIAATIARDGVWMRPRLVEDATELNLSAPRERSGKVIPDRVDLGLDKEALAACREGMIRVVNSENGTGKGAQMTGIIVAGKTGTAEAKARFDEVRDDRDQDIPVEKRGKLQVPWTKSIGRVEGKHPWYRGAGEDGSQLNHAWFIGFAPANDPQVAFAIMIEYGGSGNFAAKHAPRVVEKCIEHGYIKLSADAVSSRQ